MIATTMYLIHCHRVLGSVRFSTPLLYAILPGSGMLPWLPHGGGSVCLLAGPIMRSLQDRGFAFLAVGILDEQVPAVGREAHRNV